MLLLNLSTIFGKPPNFQITAKTEPGPDNSTIQMDLVLLVTPRCVWLSLVITHYICQQAGQVVYNVCSVLKISLLFKIQLSKTACSNQSQNQYFETTLFLVSLLTHISQNQ